MRLGTEIGREIETEVTTGGIETDHQGQGQDQGQEAARSVVIMIWIGIEAGTGGGHDLGPEVVIDVIATKTRTLIGKELERGHAHHHGDDPDHQTETRDDLDHQTETKDDPDHQTETNVYAGVGVLVPGGGAMAVETVALHAQFHPLHRLNLQAVVLSMCFIHWRQGQKKLRCCTYCFILGNMQRFKN